MRHSFGVGDRRRFPFAPIKTNYCLKQVLKDGVCGSDFHPKETKTAYVVAPESGTYTVIFADYEGKKLANIEYATVTFTEETKGTALTASITKGFSLSTGDKIMLCSNMTNLVPKCEAYIVE